MLYRLIARLLLKAVLSLAMLLGIASYGHHLAGGDPGALWQRVAGGAVGGAVDSFGELRDKAVAGASAPMAVRSDGGRDGAATERVWTWRDANGVMHYATAPPAGVEATTIRLDPNVNVLAPVRAPLAPPSAPARQAAANAPAGGDADVRAGSGASLPGIGGAIRRAGGDEPAADPARAEALLKLLQTPSR